MPQKSVNNSINPNPVNNSSIRNSIPEKKINLKQINDKYKKNQRKLLIWIGSLVLILISLVAYAAYRAGGIQNIIQGDGNIVSNTVNNVGNVITNPTSSPTPTPTRFTVQATPITQEQKFLTRSQNTLVISKFGRYNVTIKKDTYILFVNDTGKILGLEFSDGRQFRFEEKEEKNIPFLQTGTFIFNDVIDSSLNPIAGTITVIN